MSEQIGAARGLAQVFEDHLAQFAPEKQEQLVAAALAVPVAPPLTDDWLARAAEEITGPAMPTSLFDTAHVLAILRKHRDGKARMPDQAKVLTDGGVDAIEALIHAAIRWTDTGDKAKVIPSFGLLMADYRRLRAFRLFDPKRSIEGVD